MTRVILDTNVWRAVADADAAQQLRVRSRDAGLNILIAPAVVYEMLRTPDVGLRARLIKTVTLGSWERLMPDIFERTLIMGPLLAT
jgi:hypothetical protein